MIRKLLYRFRRMVLVWRLRRLRNRSLLIHRQIGKTNKKIAKLDATEMSKGEAHVVVR